MGFAGGRVLSWLPLRFAQARLVLGGAVVGKATLILQAFDHAVFYLVVKS